MKTRTRQLEVVRYLACTFLLLAAASGVKAETEVEPRISITSQGLRLDRDGVENRTKSHDELPALVTSGSRDKSSRAGGQQKMSGSTTASGTRSPNSDFWFYSADVELYSDLDFDGHYVGIDVSFDADTIYNTAVVYAVLYLSYELGPWNEYAYTEDFTIHGASGDDEYFIETELVSGYPTGSYDVLIELFDTYDGAFVASIGPDESSRLAYLPLEDVGRDTPRQTTVIVHEGGGSTGLLSLIVLLGVAGLTSLTRCGKA